MLKAKELQDKSVDELNSLLLETRQHLFKLKNEMELSKETKNRDGIRIKRKEIARLLTVINQKDVLSN